MQDTYNFNNKIFTNYVDLNDYINKNNFGLNHFFKMLLSYRIENFLSFYLYKLNLYSFLVSINLFYSILPKYKSINTKFYLNIVFLDLIFSYKGWRHFKGLPVNGQRTWTNSITVFKNNHILRNHKLSLFKKFFNNNKDLNFNSYLLLEYNNLLWKIQWEKEWVYLRKKKIKMKKNKHYFKESSRFNDFFYFIGLDIGFSKFFLL